MIDLHPTTRRYPRSTMQAFQIDQYEWYEAPPPKKYLGLPGYIGILLWVLIAALLWN